MKICILAPLYDPWLVGGAERYTKILAENLSEKHEVIVVTTQGQIPRKQVEIKKNLKVFEITPLNISKLHVANNQEDLVDVTLSKVLIKKLLWHGFDMFNIPAFSQLKKILKKEKPDLVHTNGVKGFSPLMFVAINNLKIPHVHTLHDYELISRWSALYRNRKPITEFTFFDRMYMLYLRKMSSQVHSVISPSKFMLEMHEKMGFFTNSRKFVIPNGTKLDLNVAPKKGNGKEFLLFGRVTESKGTQVAVEAFKKIDAKDIKLHIVGTGPYLETIKELSCADERIIIHGFVDDASVQDISNRCSYAIVPSKWHETFGLVIIESMNKGLPIIASKMGGIPEIVTHGHDGFLFESGNVDSLKNIMESLINQNELLTKLSKNAIETSKKFSIENHLNAVLSVYSKTSILN